MTLGYHLHDGQKACMGRTFHRFDDRGHDPVAVGSGYVVDVRHFVVHGRRRGGYLGRLSNRSIVMSDSPGKLPPSGPWSGYYLYRWRRDKHRMKLSLFFSASGRMDGDGVDDIARFIISGAFEGSSLEAVFTKIYIGMHS